MEVAPGLLGAAWRPSLADVQTRDEGPASAGTGKDQHQFLGCLLGSDLLFRTGPVVAQSGPARADHGDCDPAHAGRPRTGNRHRLCPHLRDDRELRLLSEEGEGPRSEEHTSELQSLMRISYAVFCLKKTTVLQQ